MTVTGPGTEPATEPATGAPAGGLTAMAFPGMGPLEFAEVGKFLMIDPTAGELLEEAGRVLGRPPLEELRAGTADYGAAAQVCFLVSCVALARWAETELGLEPGVCTGASFGERAAAVYAGALPFADAVALTDRLAGCVAEYFAEHHRDVVTQSFARAPREELDEILAEFADRGGWYDVSCHVDDDIFLVTLREADLDWFQRRLRAIGAYPIYVMRPPLHSGVLGGLRDLAEERILGDQPLADPALPFVSDQDGALVRTAGDVRRLLLDGFVRPVRWPATMDALRGLGVTTLCVAGPDRLFGRVTCARAAFEVVAAGPRTALLHGTARATDTNRGSDVRR
ncbi:ACP S-malonyltransferase [Actinomadura roseirufa]|uniref:ACP S-malonyltransferase n=1 Tax=Actinomadura roseirufa TaxID=2094049 RepID=UPI001F5EDF5F|nr:hypothetical protein [Actinomadura roseirufa]